MADSVRKHGYDSHAAIIRCIDECLIASFEYCESPIDLDRELVLVRREEPNIDKFPKWLPTLPPQVKCEVGRYMAKNDVTSAWAYRVETSVTGRARVMFRLPEGDRDTQVLLRHLLEPGTRYSHLPEVIAENLAMKHRNQTGSYQLHGGPPHPSSPPFGYDPRGTGKGLFGGGCQGSGPQRPAIPHPPTSAATTARRPYMAGLGRFLTQVRMDQFGWGEYPYGYALNNPVTCVDPTGLEAEDPQDACVKKRKSCDQDADNSANRCRNKAVARFNYDMKFCLTLEGPVYTACAVGANANLVAALTACSSGNAFRYELCEAQFVACKERQNALYHATCFAVAAGATYCIYQVAKDIFGGCTGNWELVLVP